MLRIRLRHFDHQLHVEQLHAALVFYSATFGSPQDVALQEMRIENFFPADEATRTALMAAQ
jgi:predicted enzyme related to lactoylglutathione lyase